MLHSRQREGQSALKNNAILPTPDNNGGQLMTTHSTMNKDTLLWMYSKMVTIRRFEEQSRREADAGKLRGMHSSIGQEAALILSCRIR